MSDHTFTTSDIGKWVRINTEGNRAAARTGTIEAVTPDFVHVLMCGHAAKSQRSEKFRHRDVRLWVSRNAEIELRQAMTNSTKAAAIPAAPSNSPRMARARSNGTHDATAMIDDERPRDEDEQPVAPGYVYGGKPAAPIAAPIVAPPVNGDQLFSDLKAAKQKVVDAREMVNMAQQDLVAAIEHFRSLQASARQLLDEVGEIGGGL